MKRVQMQVRIKRDRDTELREAHRLAFHRLATAGAGVERRRRITKAIEELIDACESYTQG